MVSHFVIQDNNWFLTLRIYRIIINLQLVDDQDFFPGIQYILNFWCTLSWVLYLQEKVTKYWGGYWCHIVVGQLLLVT